MSLVKLTLDGRTVEAPAGMLVIEAAKRAGIEIPSFCYYEGLSLSGRLPHVPRRGREIPQAHDRLHAPGC